MIDYPIIDLHVHLRNNPEYHLKIIEESGISSVVVMANTNPILDTVEKVIEYKDLCRKTQVEVHQVAAITKNLAGDELVDIQSLRKYVVGFSDDGRCLKDLNLFGQALSEDILILAHLEPETEYCAKYIEVLRKTKMGRLHVQHVSRKETVSLIREAKSAGLPVTAETCPHYLYLDNETETLNVNPPIGDKSDRLALIEGLQDGTIDVIASDYAPIPRNTGFAGARTFIPLCYGLVLNNILSEKELKQKICDNPQKIIGT